MVRRRRSVHLAVGLLAGLIAGCTEPQRRSSITEALNDVDFSPPPPEGVPVDPNGPTTDQVLELPATGGIYAARARTAPRDGPVAERTDDGVMLNFDRANVREVIKVIVGDILGRTYTVAPQVQGEVTLSSTAALDESDLLAILESVLRANNATLVQVGDGYEIAPLENALGRADVAPLGGRAPRVRPGYGVTVIPLKNITANAASQFIQPLVGSPEDIRVDAARNLILFTGTGVERQAIVDTLAELDVNWLADKAVGLFPLRVTTAEAVIRELQAIFSTLDNTGAEPPVVRFVPVARLNAVLAVGTDTEQIEEVQRWVDRLDQGETVGTQYYVYGLRHAPAEDTARLLNEIFGTGGGGLSAGAAAPAPLGASSLSPLSQSDRSADGPGEPNEGVGGEGGITPGQGILGGQADQSAPPPADGGDGGPPTGTRIVANRLNNSLVIRATPENYEQIEATLRRLDVAPLQVLIEATIAEVTLNDLLRYGVQYFIQANGVRFGFNSNPPNPGDDRISPDTQIPGFNFFYSGLRNSSVTIDALARLTDVQVLSSPSVVVQDNSQAELTVGDEVPITTRQATSVEELDSPTVNSIEYRNTGVILQVRPRINVNGVVSLEIAQEVSRVATQGGGDADLLTPVITQRRITSRINIASGQTVVLGGLIQDSQERGRDRIPILGELPVLGSFFGTSNSDNARSELIVFITPRVMRNSEDARDVSEELRSRLRSLRPLQPESVPPPVPNVVPSRQVDPLPEEQPLIAPEPLPEPAAPRRLTPQASRAPTGRVTPWPWPSQP